MAGNKRIKSEPKFSAKRDKTIIIVCGGVFCLLFLIISFLPMTGKIEEHKYIKELEKRISVLEKQLEGVDLTSDKLRELTVQSSKMDSFINNYTRLDATVSLKTNLLADRIDKLQLQIENERKTVSKEVQKVQPSKSVKTINKEEQGSKYHTVKKGETFYSISRQYGISLGKIRTLNSFSEKTVIYPGQRILVK